MEKDICFWLRREQSGNVGKEGPWLHRLCSGSELALPAPPQRVRSAALQERLAKLRKELEAKTYAAMVHDVTGEARPRHCLQWARCALGRGIC